MKKKTAMSTALGERLRDLAEDRPERAFELKRQAELFDEASYGYFMADQQTVTAKQFRAVWMRSRQLCDELSEAELAA